ncbi:VOC family protein [Bosea sp. BIWAKO-01]|uniref:VOC family protein n=1 Tax=Bosea sp. BIWAKO-01 TaxID=506668 RepID=UPI000852CDE5|nr:VOC family protein [Bosea sp. BIWAKO-01]GAU85938.1 glyoxalase [Bosea sp. BIWAKO-01]
MSGRATHFEIYGDQPEDLAAFYGAIFGWRIERAEGVDYWRIHPDEAQDAGEAKDAGEPRNGHAIGGLARPPGLEPRAWLHYVNVASLDETIATAERMGATILREKTAVPRTAWYAVLADPAGNLFAIWQPDALAFPPPEPD